jgi:EAL domain-containing protein (putative c-di-GMP-specific phosphodiesterase class I)
MSNVEAVGGIINYLNQREFDQQRPNDDHRLYHDRPLYTVEQRIHADYAGFRLGSLFQPIMRRANDGQYTVAAFEALLAAHTVNGLTRLGPLLTPQSVFALPNDSSEIVALDRLARTLHALNFLVQEPLIEEQGVDLHLNVDPHHLIAVSADHGRVFEQILRQCGLDPTAIVLEVAEHSIRNKSFLSAAIASWQSRGYRIAIDNFGREHQQLQRVLELRPDYIKVDRSLLYGAASYQRDRDLLEKILALTAAGNIRSIITGVETAAQQQLAEKIGFEYQQGVFLARPAADGIDKEYTHEYEALQNTNVVQQKYASCGC